MNLFFLLGFAGLSALLLSLAAFVLLRMADRDQCRINRIEAARGRWVRPDDAAARAAAARSTLAALNGAVAGLGQAVMQSGLMPGKTTEELNQTLSAAGLRGQNAMSFFIGAKMSAFFLLPVLAWLFGQWLDLSSLASLILVVMVGIFGMVGPDMVIQRRRQAYLKRLEAGVSDALDLMVICAQAGLSLDPAMSRVAIELQNVHPEICLELAMTVRELEMLADSAQALTNLGKRTGLECLVRLTSTLIQTMQYGTPLSESLRTLSNEMRTSALTKFEERAARLPVLLTLPMIMFILPCVFMIVGGPAAIQIGRSIGGG